MFLTYGILLLNGIKVIILILKVIEKGHKMNIRIATNRTVPSTNRTVPSTNRTVPSTSPSKKTVLLLVERVKMRLMMIPLMRRKKMKRLNQTLNQTLHQNHSIQCLS
jgi:hypothetical protein